jgi:hypothetical protein
MSFLKTMWAILKCSLMSPFTTSMIDTSTGEIIKL